MAFVGFIAFTLLFLDQSLQKIDFNMVLAVNCLCAQTVLNFIACYFADRLEEDLLEVGSVTYNMPWYKMPLKEREFLPWIIWRSQKTIKLSGFKIIDCSMATLMKVRTVQKLVLFFLLNMKMFIKFTKLNLQLFRAAGSYYLIFRQMAV